MQCQKVPKHALCAFRGTPLSVSTYEYFRLEIAGTGLSTADRIRAIARDRDLRQSRRSVAGTDSRKKSLAGMMSPKSEVSRADADDSRKVTVSADAIGALQRDVAQLKTLMRSMMKQMQDGSSSTAHQEGIDEVTIVHEM